MSVRECVVRYRLFALYVHVVWLGLVMNEYWVSCVGVYMAA